MNENQIKNNIIRNKNIFEDLKSLAFQERNEESQLKLIKLAALWACKNCTGKYSDKKIEEYLCSIANKYHAKQHDYKIGSFLHVATQVQLTGGHTRLIDNWITNSDSGEKHSLVLTHQLDKKIPEWLEEAIAKKSGDIFNINKDDYIQNMLILRELASEYEYIILYTHMYDIRPLLAFGAEEFRRPIIFYNHADHVFWLGMCITDMLVDLSSDGKDFSLQNRGNTISNVLPIPINHAYRSMNKEKAIQKIDKNLVGKKIIVSMATPYKYYPIDNYDFVSIAKEIIKNNPDSHFIVIGPDKSKQTEWQNTFQETEGRIDAVGYKQKEEVVLYKAIADLYIDSFPFYSYTSMLEFAILGVPVLSLNTPIGKIDVMYEKEVLCSNSDELIKKAHEVLQSAKTIEKYIIQKEVQQLSDQVGWKIKKDHIVKTTPEVHKVHFNFSNKSEINAHDVFIEMMMMKVPYFPFTREINNILNFKILFILFINKSIDKKMIKYFIKYFKNKIWP